MQIIVNIFILFTIYEFYKFALKIVNTLRPFYDIMNSKAQTIYIQPFK